MFGRSFGVFAAAAVFMLSAISLGATYGGGSGTAEDPYQIWTPKQMNMIGANSADWNKHFKLMDDIDMSVYTGTQYKIIGAFSGTFNGNGYVIRNLNYSTISLGGYVGLFGQTAGATIKDLGVENVSISSGGNRIGGLIGYNGGTVSDCFVSGTVHGDSAVGGIVGENNGTMKSCISRCFVTGTNKCIGGLAGYNSGRITASCATGLVSGNSSVGGLVGDNINTVICSYATGSVYASNDYIGGLVAMNSGLINACFASGSVYAYGDTSSRTGGLAGVNFRGTILNCFATGAVKAYFSVGGLVGQNIDGRICYSYATGHVKGSVDVGGLLGSNNIELVTECFWDIQTSQQANGVGSGTTLGCHGEISAKMKDRSTFTDVGWDFLDEIVNGVNDYWRLCADGVDYPRLSWQFANLGDFVCPGGVNIEDLVYYAGQWQKTGCTSDNSYCGGTDLDYSGAVNLADWAIFAGHWLGDGFVVPVEPAPIAWWQMDATEGTVVSDSIGGHDGQTVNIEGNPWQAEYHGYALKLDGINDYVQVTGFKAITGTASRTCTAWIKANSTGKEQVILSWGNAVNGQKWMFRVQADGKLAAAVWGGYIQGSVSVADGQWHHVAAVLADDGSPSVNEIKLYVDGFPQAVTYSSTQAINTIAGQNVQMGSVYSGTAQGSFFKGLLDEVRIYDVPLSMNQIVQLAIE